VHDRPVINRLIEVAAQDRLRPLGLVRKGRSRLWYDDRGWSLILVEFQTGRNLGSYLNVGAMWLWADRDDWAFDEGGRLYWRADGTFTSRPPLGEAGWTQHADFLNADQFSRAAELLAKAAAGRVTQLRDRFPSPAAVAEHLETHATSPDQSPMWHAFHRGAAAALSANPMLAEQSLTRVTAARVALDWEQSLVTQASEFLGLIADPDAMRDRVAEAIHRSRQQLGLAAVHLDRDKFCTGS
jgi:hypothetical protein